MQPIPARTLFCFSLLLLGACSPAASAADNTHTNLLFITVDDMHHDSVGAFGCRIPNITPNLDRLASEGVVFERGHVNIAICQPTRAVWLTGRYPHRNGALGFDPIRPDVPSLPEALKQAGYYNALIGKTKHCLPTRHSAFDVKVVREDLVQGRSPSRYAEEVTKAIAAAKEQGKPFFIMANAHDPHRPFSGSKQERYRPRPSVRRTITNEEAVLPGFLPELPAVRREIAEYFTSVHRADESVGAILKALDDAGLRDSTLVLFMSDHGMPLPFAKTNCYPASNRTPWIVRRPKEPTPGRRDKTNFVSGIDVTPTLLEVAGVENLPGVDGKSVLPLLAGESQEGRDKVFTMINRTNGRRDYTMRAVTTDKYIYIWNGWADGEKVFRNESQAGRTMRAMRRAALENPEVAQRVKLFLHRTREELYRLPDDEDCLNNLAGKPAAADTLTDMRKRLRSMMQQTNDHALALYDRQITLNSKAPE